MERNWKKHREKKRRRESESVRGREWGRATGEERARVRVREREREREGKRQMDRRRTEREAEKDEQKKIKYISYDVSSRQFAIDKYFCMTKIHYTPPLPALLLLMTLRIVWVKQSASVPMGEKETLSPLIWLCTISKSDWIRKKARSLEIDIKTHSIKKDGIV